MEKNRVKMNICGTDYVITSDDDVEYMKTVGQEVEELMEEILKSNSRVSVTMAAVLTALKYCDQYKKAIENADNLRNQIKDYIEDSALARMEADEAEEDRDRMKREIKLLRARLKEEALEDTASLNSVPVSGKNEIEAEEEKVSDCEESLKDEVEINEFFNMFDHESASFKL